MSVHWFTGVPGSGKTTAMIEAALKAVQETGKPFILLDVEGVALPVSRPGFEFDHPFTRIEDTVGRLKTGGMSRIMPATDEQASWIFRLVMACGGCVLGIDEIGYYARGMSLDPDLARLLRMNRHVKADVFATTQYIGDIAPLALQCASGVTAFRTTSQRGLDRLSLEYGLDPDELKKLERGQSKSWSAWS